MESPNSQKVVHYTGAAFLLALTIAVVWQMTGPTWFKNIRAEITSQPYARTITVSADGKVSAKPDIATISFSVISKGATVKLVTNENNQKMNTVIDAIKNVGVDVKDITTTQYSLNPQYFYSETTQVSKIIGYDLNQEVLIKIRDLTKVDDVLDAATKAGANSVGNLAFDIDDTGAVKKQAREKAFAEAKNKAEEMAASAGVHLGRVVTFTENNSYQPPMYENFMTKAVANPADVAVAPSVQPGTKELNLGVSVTYEIE